MLLRIARQLNFVTTWPLAGRRLATANRTMMPVMSGDTQSTKAVVLPLAKIKPYLLVQIYLSTIAAPYSQIGDFVFLSGSFAAHRRAMGGKW